TVQYFGAHFVARPAMFLSELCRNGAWNDSLEQSLNASKAEISIFPEILERAWIENSEELRSAAFSTDSESRFRVLTRAGLRVMEACFEDRELVKLAGRLFCRWY